MRRCLIISALMMLSFMAQAADRRYELHVDGMACPYCAYGIEKKIKALNGVNPSSVEIKLNHGLVIFEADTQEPMDQASFKTLINDAGFTLRQFQVQPVNPGNE